MSAAWTNELAEAGPCLSSLYIVAHHSTYSCRHFAQESIPSSGSEQAHLYLTLKHMNASSINKTTTMFPDGSGDTADHIGIQEP